MEFTFKNLVLFMVLCISTKRASSNKMIEPCRKYYEKYFMYPKRVYCLLAECGEANMSGGRIVNGMKSAPHKYPWLAAMFTIKKKYYCEGSIISDKNILTAGKWMQYAP